MIEKSFAVLLIEDSPDFAGLVRHWIDASSGPPDLILNWTETMQASFDRLERGGVDLVLLDLNLPDSSGIETLTSIAGRVPEIPIVILTANANEALAVQAIREGAEDYIIKNTCNPELLLRTVRFAIARHTSRAHMTVGASRPQTRVVSTLGAQGGVGTTTVACNLAAELRCQTGQRTLLTGLDFRVDLASFRLGLRPRHTLPEVIDHLDKLDETYWRDAVTCAPDGLEFLPSSGSSGGNDLPENLHSSIVRQLLEQIKPFYEWIVIDVGRLTADSLSLMSSSSDIFVVTTNTLSSLYEAKRIAHLLRAADIEEARLGLIVNAFAETKPLEESEIRKLFGIQLQTRLSSSCDELERACLAGTLPDVNSRFRKEIASLARRLAGLSNPSRQRRARFFSIASVFNRFRAVAPQTPDTASGDI